MDLKDLLELLKQRVEEGEDIKQVFEDNKHLFEKCDTDTKQLWKESGKDDLYEVDIHIYRKPGMGNSVQAISGNAASIMTATMSLLQILINNDIVPNKKELIKDIDRLIKDKEN